jgi:putative transposase
VTQLSHKIRLYPNQEALAYLSRSAGSARFAYNWALAEWKKLHASGEKKLSGFILVKRFNAIKHEQFPWITELSKWVPQKAIQDLGDAFSNFFQKKSRYPKFKKKGKSKDSFYLGDHAVHVTGKYLKLPKLAQPIKMAQEVRFPGTIKSVTISRDSAGDWYASFLVELSEDYIYPHRCETQAEVGIDVGLKTLVVCSDGTKFENPHSLRSRERKVKRLQCSVSRKQKGSKNRTKARLRLAKAHRKVARIRSNHWHRITSWLVRTFRFIGIETLNVQGMLKNHKLARALSDAAFSEFSRQLDYKSQLAGSTVVRADRFFASSKTCFDCGEKLEALDLSTREWVCPHCGVLHDRDMNAASNLEIVARMYRETQNACGEIVRPEPRKRVRRNSKKQESRATRCKPLQ